MGGDTALLREALAERVNLENKKESLEALREKTSRGDGI